MRIHRCPRCRAEDISADAHPARVLDNGIPRPLFVCRNCYRAAELEYRIAEHERDASLEDEADIVHATTHIRAALTDVERRLAIAPVDAT